MDPRDALPHAHRAVHAGGGRYAQCDKQAKVVGRTSTVASIVIVVVITLNVHLR